MILKNLPAYAFVLWFGIIGTVQAQESDQIEEADHARALADAAIELRDHAVAHEHAANVLAEKGRAAAAALYRERSRDLFAEADRRHAVSAVARDRQPRDERAIRRLKLVLAKLEKRRDAVDSEEEQAKIERQIVSVKSQIERIAKPAEGTIAVPKQLQEPARRLELAAQRLEKVRQAALALKEADLPGLSMEASRRADFLERQIVEQKERHAADVSRRAERSGSLNQEIAELHEQNQKLRQELRELRETLEKDSASTDESDPEKEDAAKDKDSCDCGHDDADKDKDEDEDDDDEDDDEDEDECGCGHDESEANAHGEAHGDGNSVKQARQEDDGP